MKQYLLLCCLLMTVCIAEAQGDNYYLGEAFKLLAEGNIESAERNYNVYKKMTSKTDLDFEMLLRELKEKQRNNTQQLKIGDKYNGYVICYLDETKLSGWILMIDNRTGSWYNQQGSYSSWRIPSLEETKIIYKNRFALGLNQTYWTSTQAKKVANWKFYYTFNFATGEAKATDSYKMYPTLRIANFSTSEDKRK